MLVASGSRLRSSWENRDESRHDARARTEEASPWRAWYAPWTKITSVTRIDGWRSVVLRAEKEGQSSPSLRVGM